MYQQNASQVLGFTMVTTAGAADSTVAVANVSVNRILGAGALTSGTGNLINSTRGAFVYVMSSADCNANNVSFYFQAPGDVPLSFTFPTRLGNVYDQNTGGLGNLDTAVSTRASAFSSANLDTAVSTRLAGNDPRLNTLDTAVSTRLAGNAVNFGLLDTSISTRLGGLDPRLNTLDTAVSTRLSGGDARLNTLDTAISTRFAGNAFNFPAFLDTSVSTRLGALDPRLNTLDTAISTRMPAGGSFPALDTAVSTRLAGNDPRLATLDTAISTRMKTFVVPPNFAVFSISGDGQVTVTQNQLTSIANIVLDADLALGSDANTRSPRNAFRFLRNAWTLAAGTLTVFKEDDATPAWTATVGTTPGADPVTSTDPS